MTLSDRDRKVLVFLIPVVLFAAFWFLVLSPKRNEASKLGASLTQAQTERDAAVTQASQAEASRAGFKQNYAALVRLGKAIPSSVDMPSLLVQLDRASAGTDIRFQRISVGERTTAAASTTTSSSGAASSGSASTPAGNAAPGGAPASTGAGKAAEKAGNAAQTSNSANAAAGAANTPSSTSGSSPATGGSTPAKGGAAPAGALDSVPLEFTFKGSFFHLADFFHDLKRYVRLSSGGVNVRGRLLTIDSLKLTPTSFPQIEALVTATVYLSPKTQGVTAGATPSGPAPAAGGTSPTPASTGGGSSSAPPAATAAAR